MPSEKLCRNCKKSAETGLHALNECMFTRKLQIVRHNKIADKNAKELKKIDEYKTVWREEMVSWRSKTSSARYYGNKARR